MKFTLIFLFLLILFALLFQIDEQNNLIPGDSRIVVLETQITALHAENMVLTEQILHAEALTTIAQKAKEEGFIPARIIYLTTKGLSQSP